jgi:hypothetical protein
MNTSSIVNSHRIRISFSKKFAICKVILFFVSSAAQLVQIIASDNESNQPISGTRLVQTNSGKAYTFRSVSRVDFQKGTVSIVHDGGISLLRLEDITPDSLAMIESHTTFIEAKARHTKEAVAQEMAQKKEAINQQMAQERDAAIEESRLNVLNSQITHILNQGELYRETLESRKLSSEKKNQLEELQSKIKAGSATFTDWRDALSTCSITLFTEIIGKPDASIKGEIKLDFEGPSVTFGSEQYIYYNAVLNPTTGTQINIIIDV